MKARDFFEGKKNLNYFFVEVKTFFMPSTIANFKVVP
jgi:hypothetical protein